MTTPRINLSGQTLLSRCRLSLPALWLWLPVTLNSLHNLINCPGYFYTNTRIDVLRNVGQGGLRHLCTHMDVSCNSMFSWILNHPLLCASPSKNTFPILQSVWDGYSHEVCDTAPFHLHSRQTRTAPKSTVLKYIEPTKLWVFSVRTSNSVEVRNFQTFMQCIMCTRRPTMKYMCMHETRIYSSVLVSFKIVYIWRAFWAKWNELSSYEAEWQLCVKMLNMDAVCLTRSLIIFVQPIRGRKRIIFYLFLVLWSIRINITLIKILSNK